ncbi:hypothetical protein [Streptomyces profundus]|uniref:hypothetical protein n=1 Tax=Streptomyces profundus TaxID=2867410 RepID=UPI001D15F254|nr:hypothetical protein [Streptomyces sp. MA3_2.13]UED83288.1 hypothetical protein K4G22_02965 [Streptomyces sp. MA3_2.13]
MDPYEGELAPFIGQFRVPAADGGVGRMVYLFAIGFSGEHATVVQPAGRVTDSFEIRATATGPTVLDRVHLLRVDEEVDFAEVERGLEPVAGEDEEEREERLAELLDERRKNARGSIRMNQLGGPDVVPVWLQGDALPGDGWRLVAQFDSIQLPFDVNFGDRGVGYLFLSPDGDNAEFFYQSG